MENVIKYVTGFFSGLLSIMMAVVPVAILWNVLTGGMVFGMDVVANLTSLLNSFGEGGFVEGAYPLRVITYLDDALLPCLYRLTGPFGYGAPACGFHMGKYQGCFTCIAEGKLTSPVALERDLSIVMVLLGKYYLGISFFPFPFLLAA